MAHSRPELAKLIRPRLHGAVARERLFSRLDDVRDVRPALCVVGPPGAGKTTLVASWLDSRDVEGIWYQVDAGDSDLASFFHYLGVATLPFTRRGARPLPALTSEYLSDLSGFIRRFFRELFSRLPERAVLVLDNYQEVDAGADFHRTVAEAVGEIPHGQLLIVISRRDPPDCYARLIANEAVSFLDWEDIKLSIDEATAIAAARGKHSVERIRALHAQSGGWAAGLTLLLEKPFEDGTHPMHSRPGHDAIFGYFATQVLDQLPPKTRLFLMQTAALPVVPVCVAETLTGNGRAGAILEDLYRRRLFTHRREGAEPTYWYHALFRTFLNAQARKQFREEGCSDILRRGGALLENSGYIEDAFGLYCQGQDWGAATRLAVEYAEDLVSRGRWQTLREWIVSLPAESRARTPWLEFWLGTALMPLDQEKARRHLELAFERFQDVEDQIGQLRAASGVVASYFFEWSSWLALDRWIEILERLMIMRPRYPSATVELDVCGSMLIATMYRRPGHALLPVCADTIERLLESEMPINRRVAGATQLLSYTNMSNQMERGSRIVDVVSPLVESPEVTPLNRVWWYCRLNFFLCASGRYAEAEAPTRRANEITREHGFKGLRCGSIILNAHLQWAYLGMRDWRRADELTSHLIQSAAGSRPADVWQGWQASLRLAMCQGRIAQACSEVPRTVAAAEATGHAYLRVVTHSYAAEALAEAGCADEARHHIRSSYALIADTCYASWEPEMRIMEAYLARAEGDIAECHRLLADALALARRTNPLWRDMRLHGRVLSAMLGEALSADIEADFVVSLIRHLRLEPRSLGDDAWPWPVRIYTLGCFEIIRDGKRVEYSHKAPRKQLLVLKALIALGGVEVPVQKLTDAIWPMDDGDASARALSVMLARLRGLLGSEDALASSDGRISLNPNWVWWDVRALEALPVDAEASELDRRFTRLYRGLFLAGDDDQPWTTPMRERLRARYAAHVHRVAGRLEAEGAWGDAASLYASAIETEDLSESFYRGLMRCQLRTGHAAEGLATFRRLRHVLSVVLGISPSAESLQVYQALCEAGTRHSPSLSR